MGLHRPHFLNIKGLHFFKMLGTGSSPGFSMYPDFSTYALLQTWSSKDDAQSYFSSNKYFQKIISKTQAHRIIFMSPFKSSGLWNGEQKGTDLSKPKARKVSYLCALLSCRLSSHMQKARQRLLDVTSRGANTALVSSARGLQTNIDLLEPLP